MKPPVITLDGPSASGKGTVARRVAARLGFHYLDSGAIYRALAQAVQDAGIALDDVDQVVRAAVSLDLSFDGDIVWLNGRDVSDRIRSDDIGSIASRIASCAPVRNALLARQRQFLRLPGLVADGRDMGSVVFPDALFKIFLTASPEIRALRRYKQLIQKEMNVTLATVEVELAARDARDQQRAAAPLKPAPDAWKLDTSTLDIDACVDCILAEWRKRSTDNAKSAENS